jgi:quercetin dioxygenase-like cupin family protein
MPVIDSIAWDRLPETRVHGNIRRRMFGTPQMTLVRYDFPSRGVFPRHSHPEPQVTLVLEGTFTFDYDGHADSYTAGDIVAIPGGVPHEGRAGDRGAVILCVFAPPRGQAPGA